MHDKNNLVLFSGGMDSTIALYYTLHTYTGNIYGLGFDYGQRHARELEAAANVWTVTIRKYPDRIQNLLTPTIPQALIPRTGSLLNHNISVTHSDTQRVEESAFIPHRNLLFLSIAGMWARHFAANLIVTGLRGGFSDCTPEFEREVMAALRQSDPLHNIHIESPVHKSRADSLWLAQELPGCWEALSYTVSCFSGHAAPCGVCLPCTKRAEGFAKFGEPDPLIERLRGRPPFGGAWPC